VGIVFIGGLIAGDTAFARVFADHLQRSIPGVEIRPPVFPPAQGAVLLALAQLNRRKSSENPQ
jgi:hypothetical protein